MLNIGFIFPSSDYLFDPFRGDPHTHFQILTVLDEKFGDKVSLALIDLRGIKRAFAMPHIPECDVYLYSLYTLDYEELVLIVRHLRERFPKAKHISGGPHATIFQSESMEVFDSLIIGEGESSIVEAITDLMHGVLRNTYRQETPNDINQYGFPKRHYLPASSVSRKGLMKTKKNPEYHHLLSTTVMFSRGCPYKCSFCAIPLMEEYSSKLRFRRADLVEEEIDYLKHKYHVQGISLLDEIAFPLQQKRGIEHLEAIGRTGVKWRGQTRADSLTPEVAKLARDTGCVSLSLGIESISQQSLDAVNKKITVEKSKEAIKLLKINDIDCRIYLVSGLPAEPEDVVQRTLDFLDETQPDVVSVSLFTIRPGTEIFNNPAKFGIERISKDWRSTMHSFNRYDNETPRLNFEYAEETPWGKGFSQSRIVDNFLQLQDEIEARGMSSAIFLKPEGTTPP